MPDINIGSKFDAKGFKQAETATDKLGKNVKSLAKTFGLAFGTTAILAYAKSSVKAAAADEKAQKQLALALKNVGLGRDAATSEAFIQKLQSEFGILDDKLRPAYQQLAVATQDTAESQKLLNLALDISASTGKDLGSVTSALSKAFLGNNTALSKLGVGISKADLKAGKFEDIVKQLQTTFAGSATASANTFQGSIDKLGVAAANASEIIGTGLIDALKGLGDQDSVDNLATAMQDTAIYIADVIRGIGVLTEKLKGLPGVSSLNVGMIPILGTYLEILRGMGTVAGGSGINAQGLADLARLQAEYAARTLKTKTKLTAEEVKALKAARLKAALDKANLALNKGSDVFDMDKIQIAAALTNQAEQLGKATSGAQILQIANDTARLNVKRSILALEDAIASKDEAAIVAATNKLNADLKVLSTLSMQNIKMQDIKSILDSLKPKDLINISNLNDAIAKIQEMLTLLALANTQVKAPIPTSATLGSGIPSGDFIAPIPISVGTSASIEALIEASEAIQARADAFAYLLDLQTEADTQALLSSSLALETAVEMFNIEDVARRSLLQGLAGGAGVAGAVSGSRYAAQAANAYNITVNTGIGDPNAIAEAIDQVLADAVSRGTLRSERFQ
jgi:hypothetical protein